VGSNEGWRCWVLPYGECWGRAPCPEVWWCRPALSVVRAVQCVPVQWRVLVRGGGPVPWVWPVCVGSVRGASAWYAVGSRVVATRGPLCSCVGGHAGALRPSAGHLYQSECLGGRHRYCYSGSLVRGRLFDWWSVLGCAGAGGFAGISLWSGALWWFGGLVPWGGSPRLPWRFRGGGGPLSGPPYPCRVGSVAAWGARRYCILVSLGRYAYLSGSGWSLRGLQVSQWGCLSPYWPMSVHVGARGASTLWGARCHYYSVYTGHPGWYACLFDFGWFLCGPQVLYRVHALPLWPRALHTCMGVRCYCM
jgi:hypothetical protein